MPKSKTKQRTTAKLSKIILKNMICGIFLLSIPMASRGALAQNKTYGPQQSEKPASIQRKQKEERKHLTTASHYGVPSTNLTGTLGLNVIPNARMDEVGTIRGGIASDRPYVHSFIGFQIAKPLYLSLRNTSETNSLRDDPDNLLPGLDFKLRLMEETAARPALVLGMDSALGTKRLASEYIALSKRFGNLDLTGGMAWGRLGSAGHIKNPLRRFSSHFDKPRNYTSLFPQSPNEWFTGPDVGLFAGLEYHTPINGLSLKADYGANDYIGEQQTISNFDAPAPWALSLNYKPWEQVDLSAGIIGGDTIMARLSLQEQLTDLPLGASGPQERPKLYTRDKRAIKTGRDLTTLNLQADKSTAQQIGHAAILQANVLEHNDEAIILRLKHKGLKGPKVKLIRRDIENAVLHNSGSAEEIWRDASINFPKEKKEKISFKNFFSHPYSLRLISDNKLSVSETYAGALYRTSLLLEGEKEWPFGFVTGGGMRMNLKNNLHKIEPFRVFPLQGVRTNEPAFADRRVAIDRLYLAKNSTIFNNVYMSALAGYLEEMYAGYGTEILYRPYGKTYAIGLETYRTYARNPDSTLNKDLFEKSVPTAHVNLFYELPNTNFTAYGKFGSYLRRDLGGTVGFKNKFDNGTSLEGYVTVTNQAYKDILGNRTHFDGGIKLNIPFGNLPFVPNGSEARLHAGPLARNVGQFVQGPNKLYDVTEPISYRSISRSWPHLRD